jgi:hypothetical protein
MNSNLFIVQLSLRLPSLSIVRQEVVYFGLFILCPVTLRLPPLPSPKLEHESTGKYIRKSSEDLNIQIFSGWSIPSKLQRNSLRCWLEVSDRDWA